MIISCHSISYYEDSFFSRPGQYHHMSFHRCMRLRNPPIQVGTLVQHALRRHTERHRPGVRRGSAEAHQGLLQTHHHHRRRIPSERRQRHDPLPLLRQPLRGKYVHSRVLHTIRAADAGSLASDRLRLRLCLLPNNETAAKERGNQHGHHHRTVRLLRIRLILLYVRPICWA